VAGAAHRHQQGNGLAGHFPPSIWYNRKNERIIPQNL